MFRISSMASAVIIAVFGFSAYSPALASPAGLALGKANVATHSGLENLIQVRKRKGHHSRKHRRRGHHSIGRHGRHHGYRNYYYPYYGYNYYGRHYSRRHYRNYPYFSLYFGH